MISKTEILLRAREWGLAPEVVEKDYVLGWLLAGIARNATTSSKWVFKGGTCLKKCVLETYRFSEDLDFTLLPDAPYTAAEIEELLKSVAADVETTSGIHISSTGVREKRNRAGELTFEGAIGYRGPLAIPGPPKLRLDLTRHEPVILPVVAREIFHGYPDGLPAGVRARTYDLRELLAEKTRALVERTRPRDLYDVVLLSDTAHEAAVHDGLLEVARKKFQSKGLTLPTPADIERLATESDELRAEWDNMLGHQLPALPDLDDFIRRLPDAVSWLAPSSTPVSPVVRLPRVSAPATQHVAPVPASRLWNAAVPLEAIRYAGTAHLLVEIRYHSATRVIEPYSLRRPATGNLLLYGFERTKNGFPTNDIRPYKVAELEHARVLTAPFTPRYEIELIERSGVWRW